jgi:hypothetical protein
MDLQRNGGGGGMDWIGLARSRDSWRALLYVVMKLRVSLNADNFLKCEGLVRYNVLCPIQSVI